MAEDRHAQGYIAGLQKQRRLKQYLNMVYSNATRERLQHAVQQSKSPMTRQPVGYNAGIYRDSSQDQLPTGQRVRVEKTGTSEADQ